MNRRDIFVLAGTHTQFVNFSHAFGPGYVEIEDKMSMLPEMRMAAEGGRVMVLLVGTWTLHPLRDAVLSFVDDQDRQGRPRGQCFAMLGRPQR